MRIWFDTSDLTSLKSGAVRRDRGDPSQSVQAPSAHRRWPDQQR